MISIKFNDKKFLRDITNILAYSDGFMEGVQKGRPLLLNAMGARTVEGAKEFIDSYARVNPEMLHHVYEWYRTGSPDARLFDISYRPYGNRIFFENKFSQSQTIKSGSKVPFENKASVMENGQALIIKPKTSTNLVFDVDGKTVFTPNPVTVTSPGGAGVVNGFEKTFDLFFNKYFSQSFLISSGIMDYLSKPIAYKTNIRAGKTGGKSVGVSAGYRWVVNAGGRI